MLDTVFLPILTVKHIGDSGFSYHYMSYILIDRNLATDVFSNVCSPSTDNVIDNYQDRVLQFTYILESLEAAPPVTLATRS